MGARPHRGTPGRGRPRDDDDALAPTWRSCASWAWSATVDRARHRRRAGSGVAGDQACARRRHAPALASAYQQCTPLRRNWEGHVVLRSYRQGIALLRMALIGGDDPRRHRAAAGGLPGLPRGGLPASAGRHLRAPVRAGAVRPHPPAAARRGADRADRRRAARPGQRRRCCAPTPKRTWPKRGRVDGLRVALAEHLILCGRLDDAAALLADLDESLALFFRSVILLLRDDLGRGAGRLRRRPSRRCARETGKRKAVLPRHRRPPVRAGPAAQRRRRSTTSWPTPTSTSPPARCRTTTPPSTSSCRMLRQIRGGTVDADVLPSRNWETALQPFMFRALMHYWLAQPQLARQARRAGADAGAVGAGRLRPAQRRSWPRCSAAWAASRTSSAPSRCASATA